MEESNKSRLDTLKSNQPISMNAEVQTENGMHRVGKSCRVRGRGHWRGCGRGNGGFRHRTRGDGGPWNKRRRFGHTGTVDDFPFLHGGNSKDPLNLKSVKPVDEAENMKPIDIIIPKNIHDPLNLRNVNKNRARRKRRYSKLTEKEEIEGNIENPSKQRTSIASGINEKRQDDPIVSPVPLSIVRKFCGNSSRRVSHQKVEKRGRKLQDNAEKPQPSSGAVAGASNSQPIEMFKREEKIADAKKKKLEKKEKDNQRFRYGNYTRYYGSRLEKDSGHDPRMQVLKKEWFERKSVLDIGCNVGYLTLSIAKEFQPRNIVGIDIDAHLVGVARKNIRHYCDNDVPIVGGFPVSFAQRYGPVSAPHTTFSTKFPDNVWFRCENYVLEKDEFLDAVKEEYDVIMALSITKWIHLNWGDAGIKRFFKRVYRNLRPGGLFILEPQSFETYKKRSKLTKDINDMYKSIEFMPNAFQEYLVVDIGFDFCKHIDPPKAHTKGFERPIQVYCKRMSYALSRTSYNDHDGIPKTFAADSFSPSDVTSENTAKLSIKDGSLKEMDWPEFDFANDLHIESQRLSSAGKLTCDLKRNRPRTCRSLISSESIRSRKKKSSPKGRNALNENITILRQQMLQNNNPATCAQGDSSRMNRKINTKRVPPLSPIMVNGFLRSPTADSPTLFKDLNLNVNGMMTSLKHKNSMNPLTANISLCEDPIILFQELLFSSPNSKQSLLSGENPSLSLQSSMIAPRGQSSKFKSNTSFITVTGEYDNVDSKSRENDKKTNLNTKLRVSPPNVHSLDGSLTSLETLPPSKIDFETLNKNESSSVFDFMVSQLSFESDKPTSRHTRIDNDVFHNHIVGIDDSGSICSTSEESFDRFFDVTIHEIQPSDPDFNTQHFLETTSSSETNQLSKYDYKEENDEATHQKQCHRLSKLAEILKKRLYISSSDSVMWKCDEPKQDPVGQVMVVSNVVQWGFWWTLVRNVSDSKIIHIVDSEPMKSCTDMLPKERNRTNSDDQAGSECQDSAQQSLQKTFSIYQPLSKLNTSLGEFILSPRYYR